MLESPEPDPARPTPAGIYDYLLRGQHYSAADQAAAEQAVAMTPATRSEVIENRAFLRRAVRYLASRGITQYLDLGSGYPAGGAVHQTAAELITSPRVVYVDNDPRVAEISRGLLDSPDTAVIVRDVRRPADIIGDPQTRRLIDWSRPVAVLMVSILHFIQDEVAGFLAGFDLVPPGLVTTVEWGTDRPPATGAGSILAAVGTVPAGEAPVS